MNFARLSCVVPIVLLAFRTSAPAAPAEDQITLQGGFAPGLGNWVVHTMEHTEATATTETSDSGKQFVHITVPKPGDKRYYVQLVGKGIALRGGKTYHLHFRAHGKPSCEISVIAGSYQAGKFSELWRQDHVILKDSWTDQTCEIIPKEDDQSGQIIFGGLAAQAGEYWFGDVTLTE